MRRVGNSVPASLRWPQCALVGANYPARVLAWGTFLSVLALGILALVVAQGIEGSPLYLAPHAQLFGIFVLYPLALVLSVSASY